MPVETGETYLSAGSGTKLMSISEFISTFILLQNTQGGYLAQHQVILCTKYFEEATSLSLFLVVSTSARVGERHHSSGLLRPIND